MELYLLRHGTSLANEKNLVCGSSDYPLSNTGILQAQHICNLFQDILFTRIYSSPLSRAKDTIAYLKSHAQIIIQSNLVELNTGNVSALTLPELWETDNRFRKPWLYPDMRYPEGECFREMVARITDWYDSTSKQWNDDEKVLIVGHEGTLRSIYLRLHDLSLENYPDFPINNCDYIYFSINNGKVDKYKHIPLGII